MTIAEIREKAATFDASLEAPVLHEYDRQRAEMLERFPLAGWPALPLTRYALGQEDSTDTFSRYAEFVATQLGSIKGGASNKHIIYKHRTKPGWHFDRALYADEQEAWTAVRGAFVRAFDLAREQRWSEIDGLSELAGGQALLVKALHLYFPDELLPINSRTHLRHFLAVCERPEAESSALGAVLLNRALLTTLRQVPELAPLRTKEIERFLYRHFRPDDAQPALVKISPGDNAMFWEDCRENGYVVVGWDDIGDLRSYASYEEYYEAFAQIFEYGTNSKVTEKANELWRLTQLQPGDRIVANQGTSQVLALGTVIDPGYVYLPERETYNHAVRVDWDLSYAKQLAEPVKRWALVTVADVKGPLRARILGEPEPQAAADAGAGAAAEPLHREIAAALQRRGQVILYGPPGTGKTYAARRFAQSWLTERNGDGDGLTIVTFHASYAYEDWVEGFRPQAGDGGALSLELDDGLFFTVCAQARAHPGRTFLVLIDEINRANVAKVFGELITLIEKDKRGLQIRLAQSKREFTVPPNVFLLGTMNTADRSITLLDAALRRRFAFVEIAPDPSLLEEAVGGLDLAQLLTELNQRIAAGAGADKQIGHAYFMTGGQPVASPEELAAVMRYEVVPLLQEYCFGDLHLLAGILGEELVDVEGGRVRDEKLGDPDALVAALAAWQQPGE